MDQWWNYNDWEELTLWEKPDPVPVYPPHIWHRLAWDWTSTSTVWGQSRTTWDSSSKEGWEIILNWVIVKQVMKMLNALNWLRIISSTGLWCSIIEHLSFLSLPCTKMAFWYSQVSYLGSFPYECYSGFRFCPSPLENVSLCVPSQHIRDFALFNVGSKHHQVLLLDAHHF